MVPSLLKTVQLFVIKLNMLLLPFNSAMPFLGIYLKDLKSYIHAKRLLAMCIIASFIIAKMAFSR